MTNGRSDKLNMLAAGLLTAVAAHVLMCVAALPGVVSSTTEITIAALTLKSLRILWEVMGTAGGVFVAVQIFGLINGQSLRQARVGAFGALVLPLLGSIGAITAFALIPLGLFAVYTLRPAEPRLSSDAELIEA